MRIIMSLCPCGSKLNVDACCAPIIAGEPAPTAEALMRSRYAAFVLGSLDHVERTHAAEVRDDFNRAEAERLVQECEFQGLEIRYATETGDTAEVDFVIRFRRDQKDMIQVELAQFRREAGHWLYVNGKINPQISQRLVSKVGRNDPCPCGSGKKAKKCCGILTDQGG
ncbi:MAG: YchJ family protein [Burkholderiaceae bacterium]